MAVTVTEQYTVDDLYDWDTGLMRATREFVITGPETAEEQWRLGTAYGTLPVGIPEWLDMPSVRLQPQASPPNMVVMWPVSREIPERFAPTTAKMQVTYEGHELGVMKWNIDADTGSREIIADLTGAKVGDEGAAITIENPEQTMTVIENYWGDDTNRVTPCLTLPLLRARLYLIQNLSATVNENNWTPAFWGDAFPAGWWLYLGAEHVMNRDATVTFEHKFVSSRLNFAAGSYTPRMHIHRYANRRMKVGTDTMAASERDILDYDASDTLIETTIYEIAGTAPVTVTFAELGL